MQDADTVVLRNLNTKLYDEDDHITLSFLPVGDGLMLAMKN